MSLEMIGKAGSDGPFVIQHNFSRSGYSRRSTMSHTGQESLWVDGGPQGQGRPVRPIHYLGSKLRLVGQIGQTLDEVDPARGRVIDLFAGSGTVSASLAESRPVTAVDIQEFSRTLCSALLQPRSLPAAEVECLVVQVLDRPDTQALAWAMQPLIDLEAYCLTEAESGRYEPLAELLDAGAILSHQQGADGGNTKTRATFDSVVHRLSQHGLTRGPRAVISRYYGGVYFSFAQALQLDALLASAHEVPSEYQDIVKAAVVSTASEVVNSVGKQFAQPIRIRTRSGLAKPHVVSKVIKDRTLSVPESFRCWLDQYTSRPPYRFPHCAVRQDFADFLERWDAPVGAVYADPPYTRDHYSRYYHVLETICLGDAPLVSRSNLGGGTAPSRGMYRQERHQSPFCIKSQAPAAFERLFLGAHRLEVPLLVSYSPYDKDRGAHPRLMSIDQLVSLASRIYRSVEVRSFGRFAHSKLNASRHTLSASSEAEVLIICRP